MLRDGSTVVVLEMYSHTLQKSSVQSKLGFVVFQNLLILKPVVPYEETNEGILIKYMLLILPITK